MGCIELMGLIKESIEKELEKLKKERKLYE
mgnify:CR=1 FL=1